MNDEGLLDDKELDELLSSLGKSETELLIEEMKELNSNLKSIGHAIRQLRKE